MKRIVIQLSELSHENWNYIYRFIERCLGSKQFRKTDFDAMQNNEIKIGIDDNPTNNDVCSMIDKGIKELRYEELAESGDYVFNIIYDKTDEREEFSDFVRFFLLKKKYAGRLTLGINLDVFKNDESFNKYKFQLGIFLFFIKDKCPLLGRHSLYLVKAENGTTKVSAIPYMIETSDINYKLASPYLLPLIPINKSNFGIFENVGTKKNEVGLYIEHSLDSIRKRLEKSRRGILNLEDCHTLFEKWLVSSFYLSLEDQGIEEFNNCKPVLLEYCHNIFELAQNIIYHTDEKQGLIYMVVNKKEKVSKTLQSVIPNFDDYEKSTRFLEFGVFDYGDKGIVRTFCEQENLINENYRLGDFFVSDKQSNLFESYNSEHLGIRSFTNSIKEHNGFFRVESNYSNSSKAIVEIANDSVLKESLDVENVNGTHYDVVIPIFNLLYSEKMAISASRNSLRNIFKEYGMKLPMYPTIQSRVIEELFLSTFDNKEEQEKRIDEAAQELLVEVSNKTNVNGVAIDMKSIDLRPSILYKIIDNLIKNNNIHKTIDEGFLFMLINLKNEIIDRVCENYDTDISLLPSNEYHFPVILIGEQWKVQILYGKTREELLYVNRRVHSLFLSRNHFGRVSLAGDNLSIKEKNRAEKFVLPYDLMIDDKNCEPLFSSFINKALDTPIENVDDAMGCKISFPTKIGSKLYIENYYEADFLFHNNFFTDRFAYFIAQEIVGKIKEINSGFFGKKLVLIGYNPYSAPLVERVKEYVNDCFVGNMVTDIVIATQKERDNDLVFKMSEKQALAFLNKKEKYNFITIVPIASTLSTTDKIIALFNKKLEDFIRNYEEKTLLFPSPTKKLRIKFVYNYVTILVRDRI